VDDLRIDLLPRRATRGGQRLHLSIKEFGLLVELARRKGQIVSKTALAELVWGINFDTNTNVVEVAIKRLRAKIDPPGSTKLLHTVRSMGYVLEAREEPAS
jgi:two-component system copper resistance phosphate regulon response regulator CusR